MAAHSSVLAWRLPGAGEPGGLPMGVYGVAQSQTRLKRLSSSSSSGKTGNNAFALTVDDVVDSPYSVPPAGSFHTKNH